jgi:hypothetical protein
VLVTWAGTLTSNRLASVWSTAAMFFLHHFLALAAVGLLDGVFDLLDGFLARQHAGQGEEAGLHDRVDARAHAGGLGHREMASIT